MQTDLIVISEYCQNCHVDPSFIKMLESEGLISLQTIEDEKYIVASELRELEQYTRMYYDLSINIEGIDTIHLDCNCLKQNIFLLLMSRISYSFRTAVVHRVSVVL